MGKRKDERTVANLVHSLLSNPDFGLPKWRYVTYGAPRSRILEALRDRGFRISAKRLDRILEEDGRFVKRRLGFPVYWLLVEEIR